MSKFSQNVVLKGFVQDVPESFFGTWRVVSKRIDTDSPAVFKEKGLDLWNLSQENDVIKLSNPFSGASAEINIQNSTKNKVEFTKIGRYDNKKLTDTVKLSINGDSFVGVDI